MKISRRDFIQFGAAALVAGVLPESKQATVEPLIEIETAEPVNDSFSSVVFPDWRSFELGLLEETAQQMAQVAGQMIEDSGLRNICESDESTPAERLYAKALEAMPVEAKEKQVAFIEEVLETGGDVWPSPPEKWGSDMFEGFVSGIEITSEIGKDAQGGEVVYFASRVEAGPEETTPCIPNLELKEVGWMDAGVEITPTNCRTFYCSSDAAPGASGLSPQEAILFEEAWEQAGAGDLLICMPDYEDNGWRFSRERSEFYNVNEDENANS